MSEKYLREDEREIAINFESDMLLRSRLCEARARIEQLERENRALSVPTPEGWRLGQTLFNFLEWLRVKKDVHTNQNQRMADPFNVPDGEFTAWFEEFVGSLPSPPQEDKHES